MKRALALAVTLVGCQYDYDKLYEHVEGDSSTPKLTSTALISNWIGNDPQVDQDCITCAEQTCADKNTACLADPTCVEYTKCVGADPTPSGQAACRQKFSAWVNTVPNVRDRDLGGPYGQCVFRYSCTAQCADDAELWCVGQFAMQTTSEQTVPLSLYLIDAFDQSPIAGASVSACSAQNARECTDAKADAMGVTDANGLLKLQLPSSFSRAFTGYLEITGAGRYPTLLKFSWNIGQETTQVVSIVAEASFKAAISAVFLKTDDTTGMLQLRMLGCQGAGVQGVHFSYDNPAAASRSWYIVNGVPKLDATSTTPVGSGGIIDVPEGTVHVRAATADNTLVGECDAPVRAKFMTVVIYAPKGR